MKTQKIVLSGSLEIALPDGTVIRVQPGPYGKGISLVPITKPAGMVHQPKGRRGRPLDPSTLLLRETLAKDLEAGRLRSASHYVDWLTSRGAKAQPASLRQTVYRELRSVRGGKAAPKRAGAKRRSTGKRGRAPHPATLVLRERLAKDKPDLKDAQHYIRWLVDETRLGLRQARPIVYRELRAAR